MIPLHSIVVVVVFSYLLSTAVFVPFSLFVAAAGVKLERAVVLRLISWGAAAIVALAFLSRMAGL